MQMECLQPNFQKMNGLVSVVVQHYGARKKGRILMVAFANEEAYRLTLSTGYAHFWSRTRQAIWKKGESSGNVLVVRDILIDCDGDALLYRVEESGPVCHTGRHGCFFRNVRYVQRAARCNSVDALPTKEREVSGALVRKEGRWGLPG